MPPKHKDGPQLSISPVLFLTVEGEPMRFFLRPGPMKRDLQPLITAGGGTLCKVQQPGAILLIGPEEKGSIPESAASWYVSTQYIHDCIEKDEQLELEAYRLKPEGVQRYATRLNSRTESLLGGRVPYTPEDDAAILKYVSQHKSEIGGNCLWQVMEKKRVTTHSWQSMKYRYKARLSKKQTEVSQVKATGDSNKTAEEKTEQVEPNQESDVQKPSSGEDAAPPQAHPADANLTQIDELYEPAGGDSENKEAEAIVLQGEEEQHADEQSVTSAEGESRDAEMSDQPEDPPVDPQTENSVTAAEITETERDELQTHSGFEDPPAASQPEATLTPSSEKLQGTRKASPDPEPPQGQVPRRPLELKAPSSSPESDSKKLGSSSAPTTQPGSSSPQAGKKAKSGMSNLQRDESSEAPPPKKARGQSPTPETETSRQPAVSETSSADESHSAPQKAKTEQTEKRPLGILEQATKEFEDESESDEEETPDLLQPVEEAVAAAEPVPSTSNAAVAPASPRSERDPEPEPDPGHPEGGRQSPQTSRSDPAAESVSPDPAAGEPAVREPSASGTVGPASKAHLFIFESESQGEAACSRLTTSQAAAQSLTQEQLEEDVQLLVELMNQTKQDLGTVTKALLRTSGDPTAAHRLLLNPSSVSGPFWRRCDDRKLLSGDSGVQTLLLEKYGEEEVAKRIVFLEGLE